MDTPPATGHPAAAAGSAAAPLPTRSGLRLGPAAVFAGAIIGASITLLFSILGVAVGLYDFDTFTSGEGLNVNDGVWHVAVATIALFIGGWTTSRLAGPASAGSGALRGLVTWVLAAVLGIWVITVLTSGLAINNARISGTSQPAARAVAPAVESPVPAIDTVQPEAALDAEAEAVPAATPPAATRRTAPAGAAAATAGAGVSPGTATRHFLGGLDRWSWIILIASAVAAIIGGAAGRTRGPRAV